MYKRQLQEYLFTSDQHKADIETVEFVEKVKKSLRRMENSACWILVLEVKGESEDAAKLLDPINTQICEKYAPTVLTNECSGYFNKSLFPIINEFERKLRKLLYLASALQDDSNDREVISNLETEELGKLFETLFSDSEFVKSAKETINRKTWQFTKKEVLDAIRNIDEHTCWDALLGPTCVKTLREHFGELRRYRNDVMHAHNINYTQYRAAKQMFMKTNKELDIAIDNLIGIRADNRSTVSIDFNSVLGEALSTPTIKIDMSGVLPLYDMALKAEELKSAISPEALKSLESVGKKVSAGIISNLEITKALANLGELATMQSSISQMEKSINEALKQMRTYTAESCKPYIGLQQDKGHEMDKESTNSDDITADDGKD